MSEKLTKKELLRLEMLADWRTSILHERDYDEKSKWYADLSEKLHEIRRERYEEK